METTERRAGQRWRWTSLDGDNGEFTIIGREIGMWKTLPMRAGDVALWDDDCWDAGGRWEMTLLNVPAAAPLAADRTKCHPDCGKSFEEYDRSSARPMCVTHQTAHDKAAKIAYCAPACRDARLPPLAAQPAETKPCVRCEKAHDMDHPGKCQPAPQPAPAKPVCGRCGNAGYVKNVPFEQGLLRLCVGCTDNLAAWLCAQSGTPYTGPERLERPKLAHSYGVEDPALENA